MTPKSLVEQTHTLFSLPEVALRVNQLIDAPGTRPVDLAEVILCDAALSARLLRLVNSAFHARPQPVETVSQAIGLIGYRPLRDLVIATCAVDLFKGLPAEQVDMERFWLHGVACGIAARHLAGHCGPRNGERLFLAGLLHRLGQLIFFTQCADDYVEVLRLVDQEGLEIVAAEERVFGFHYADLSAELLRTWGFPESIWVAVAHHVDPSGTDDRRLEAEILHGAEQVARMVQSIVLATPDAPAIDDTSELQVLSERLGLAPDALAGLPDEINRQVIELFEILVPGSALVY